MFVRGEGVHLYDEHGKRYLDGLSGLFVVQIGHGRREVADAAAAQAATLAYYPIWSAAHPTAVELAARLAAGAPGDLNRVFFTTGGSEAVESAWKLARTYFRAIGATGPRRRSSPATSPTTAPPWARSRSPASPRSRRRSNRWCQARCTSPTPTASARPSRPRSPPTTIASQPRAPNVIEEAIVAEGPDTVCAVYLEPVQNTGGCFPPPPGYFRRVREICDRYGVLLVSDEVICGFGRLGAMFAGRALRLRARHDHVRQRRDVGYAPLGGVIASDTLAEPFLSGRRQLRARHHVRGTSGQLRHRTRQPRRVRARRDRRARPERTRRHSDDGSSRCAICRSSVTSAATATSSPSSW